MRTLFTGFAAIVAATAMLAVLPIAALAADSATARMEKAALAGRALTTTELYRIYGNRSWLWEDGAGFFKVSERAFTAWSKRGSESSYADGTWFLTERGRLCFRASWNAVGGSAKALTCFEHRDGDGTIYQRRLPDGEWYVFSHAKPRAYDEIRKLRRGDHVRRNYEINKRYVEARAPKATCSGLFCRLFGS